MVKAGISEQELDALHGEGTVVYMAKKEASWDVSPYLMH